MAVEEKEAAMEAFRSGQSQILVSTTVVEVGVDVPNASVMLIESADRFGLSQLHQLRGRVGRGQEASYCYLMGPEWCSENAYQRLTIMAQTSDGFEIAEKDLQMRGPGELLGTKQSGVPGLVRADLIRDQDLLLVAKKEARVLVENDRHLHKPEHQRLRQALDKKWEGNLPLSQVG
jgi:ATP-dependent DNA helicase RecG